MKKLVEHIQIYITHVRQNKEFKGRVQIIDGTLNLIIQRRTFSQWSRKGKVKGSKDFTLLYTWTYIPKSQFITDHTKEIAGRLFWGLWKMCQHGKY
nr:hypothetical protein [Mycoplasmopsis bovis]